MQNDKIVVTQPFYSQVHTYYPNIGIGKYLSGFLIGFCRDLVKQGRIRSPSEKAFTIFDASTWHASGGGKILAPRVTMPGNAACSCLTMPLSSPHSTLKGQNPGREKKEKRFIFKKLKKKSSYTHNAVLSLKELI